MLVNRKDLIGIFGTSVGQAMFLRAYKLKVITKLKTKYINTTRKGKPTEALTQHRYFDLDSLIDSYIYNVDPRYARQCRDREMKLKRYKEER